MRHGIRDKMRHVIRDITIYIYIYSVRTTYVISFKSIAIYDVLRVICYILYVSKFLCIGFCNTSSLLSVPTSRCVSDQVGLMHVNSAELSGPPAGGQSDLGV